LKFEAEYGSGDNYPQTFLGAVEAAKYRLDWASLELRDWMETVQKTLSFEYELRHLTRETPATTAPRRLHDNIFHDAWENARLESDINLKLSGRTFFGIKLSLPFGD
jgi:hypothetical protein